MTPEQTHHHHRRRHRSRHKFRRRMKKALYWVILPLLGSALLVKTLAFYFGAP